MTVVVRLTYRLGQWSGVPELDAQKLLYQWDVEYPQDRRSLLRTFLWPFSGNRHLWPQAVSRPQLLRQAVLAWAREVCVADGSLQGDATEETVWGASAGLAKHITWTFWQPQWQWWRGGQGVEVVLLHQGHTTVGPEEGSSAVILLARDPAIWGTGETLSPLHLKGSSS